MDTTDHGRGMNPSVHGQQLRHGQLGESGVALGIAMVSALCFGKKQREGGKGGG